MDDMNKQGMYGIQKCQSSRSVMVYSSPARIPGNPFESGIPTSFTENNRFPFEAKAFSNVPGPPVLRYASSCTGINLHSVQARAFSSEHAPPVLRYASSCTDNNIHSVEAKAFPSVPSPPSLRYSYSSPSPQAPHREEGPDEESLEQERLRLLWKLRAGGPVATEDVSPELRMAQSSWWSMRGIRGERSVRGELRLSTPERAPRFSSPERAASPRDKSHPSWTRFIRSRKEKTKNLSQKSERSKKLRSNEDEPMKNLSPIWPLDINQRPSTSYRADVQAPEQNPKSNAFESPHSESEFAQDCHVVKPSKGPSLSLLAAKDSNPETVENVYSSRNRTDLLDDDDSVGDHTLAPPPQLDRNPSFFQRMFRKEGAEHGDDTDTDIETRRGMSPTKDDEATPPPSPVIMIPQAYSSPVREAYVTPPPLLPPPLLNRKSSILERIFPKNTKDSEVRPPTPHCTALPPTPIRLPSPTPLECVDSPAAPKTQTSHPSRPVETDEDKHHSTDIEMTEPALLADEEVQSCDRGLLALQLHQHENTTINGYATGHVTDDDQDLDQSFHHIRHNGATPPPAIRDRWSPSPAVDLMVAHKTPPKLPTRHREAGQQEAQKRGTSSPVHWRHELSPTPSTMSGSSQILVPRATRPVTSTKHPRSVAPKPNGSAFQPAISRYPAQSIFTPKTPSLRISVSPPTVHDGHGPNAGVGPHTSSIHCDHSQSICGRVDDDDDVVDEEVSLLSRGTKANRARVPSPKQEMDLLMQEPTPKGILKRNSTAYSCGSKSPSPIIGFCPTDLGVSSLGRFQQQQIGQHFKPLPEVKQRYSVGFGHVQIREYERTVGDNPACSSGAPLTIGWNFVNEYKCSLGGFEQLRLTMRRRERRDLYLSSSAREQILLDWSCPPEDIRKARREAMYIQYCREKAVFSQKNKSRPQQQQSSPPSGWYSPPPSTHNSIADWRQPDVSDTSQPPSGGNANRLIAMTRVVPGNFCSL